MRTKGAYITFVGPPYPPRGTHTVSRQVLLPYTLYSARVLSRRAHAILEFIARENSFSARNVMPITATRRDSIESLTSACRRHASRARLGEDRDERPPFEDDTRRVCEQRALKFAPSDDRRVTFVLRFTRD